jgi:hypothetical protein
MGHSLVYEPDQDLVVAFGGTSPARGDPNNGYRMNDSKRLDCAGGWWLETGAAANGDVLVDPDRACFAPGQEIHLIASPTDGGTINQWLGDASGNDNPLTVTMDANKTIWPSSWSAPRRSRIADRLRYSIHPNPSVGRPRSYALPRGDEATPSTSRARSRATGGWDAIGRAARDDVGRLVRGKPTSLGRLPGALRDSGGELDQAASAAQVT